MCCTLAGPWIGLVATAVYIFGFQTWPIVYMVMPWFVALSFRGDHRGAPAGLFMLAVIAAAFTVADRGTFASAAGDAATRATLIQIYITVVGLTTLVFEAIVREKNDRDVRTRTELRTIVDSLDVMVFMKDPGGRILRCNEAAAASLGRTVDEVAGRRVAELFPDDYQRFARGEGEIFRSGRAVRNVLERFRKPDGDQRIIDVSKIPFRDRWGEVAGLVVVVNDVTAIRRAEHDLADANHRLQASNEELVQFANVASHDLKAPLRAIHNLAGFIREDCGDDLPADSRRHLELMRGRIDRMAKLLDDLLAFSRVGRTAQSIRAADARSVLVSAADSAGVDVDVDAPVRPGGDPSDPTRPHVSIDAGAVPMRTFVVPLQKCLRNLISNAAVHGRPTRPGAGRGRIELRAAADRDDIVFDIDDDGDGIPGEHHRRVFRMFETLRPRDAVEGSGMGLAMVAKTVEAYGGSVELISPNRRGGTTFRLRWPRVCRPPRDAIRQPDRDADPAAPPAVTAAAIAAAGTTPVGVPTAGSTIHG